MQNIFVKILSKKYHYVLFKTHVRMKNTKYEKRLSTQQNETHLTFSVNISSQYNNT